MSSENTIKEEHIDIWVEKTRATHLMLLQKSHIIDEVIIKEKNSTSNNFILKAETYTYVGVPNVEIKLPGDLGYSIISNNFSLKPDPEHESDVIMFSSRFSIDIREHQIDFIFSCYNISHHLANFKRIIDYINADNTEGRFESYRISIDEYNRVVDIDLNYSIEEKNFLNDNRKFFKISLYSHFLENSVNNDLDEGDYDADFMMDAALYQFYGELYEYAFLDQFPKDLNGFGNFNLFRKNREQILGLYRIITY